MTVFTIAWFALLCSANATTAPPATAAPPQTPPAAAPAPKPPEQPAPTERPAPPAPGAAAPAPAPDQGFVELFNGKDLAGWTGDTAGYVVENGCIVCGPKGTNLFTAKEYSDFTLRFEFQLTPGANNGIGLRAPLQGDAAYDGMEVQVLDTDHDKYKGWLKPYQRHGSVYGVVEAKHEGMKPVGEWNTEEISLIGSRVKVTLNGTVIVDADLHVASKDGTLDGKPHPGLARTSGHIGFLGHGDRVAYRNIRIRLP